MSSTHESDDAFEAWVDGEEQLRAHAVHAAFRAGWNAGSSAERQVAQETIAMLTAALEAQQGWNLVLLEQIRERDDATEGMRLAATAALESAQAVFASLAPGEDDR